MDIIIKVIFITILGTVSLVTSTKITTQANTASFLKEDIELGLHDAVLQLDQAELASGKLVFNQSKAKETFIKSFEESTGLSSSEYQIKEFVFLDENNSTFPTEYSSTVGDFRTTVIDPTILAVIETKSNSYYANNSPKNMARMASYSVKTLPNNTSLDAVLSGAPNNYGLIFPSFIGDEITSSFGKRNDPFTDKEELHAGIDITSSTVDIENSPVIAAKVEQLHLQVGLLDMEML